MRLNKRNHITEQQGFDDLPDDYPEFPVPPYRPGAIPYPGYPFLPKPYSTPYDAPKGSPSHPDFGDREPDMPPQFPPDADANGDGVVSQEEFLAYARQILRAAGFSEKEIKILLKLIRDGRSPTFGEKFRLRNIDQDLLRRLLKRIQREFPGGTPFVLPSDF